MTSGKYRYVSFAANLMLVALMVPQYAMCEAKAAYGPDVAYFNQMQSAATKGDVESQICLGSLYDSGIGTTANGEEAYKWYRKAASQKKPHAEQLIGEMYMLGENPLKENQKKALVIFNHLVDNGYLPAATDIGNYYMSYADKNKRNYTTALYWYRKGASGDDYIAEISLSNAYQTGLGVKKNRVESQLWLKKAADHNVECLAGFRWLVDSIIAGNVVVPKDIHKPIYSLKIGYVYKNRRATNPVILKSSGSLNVDQAFLADLQSAQLPPWPEKYKSNTKAMVFWMVMNIESQEKQLSNEIHIAIKHALMLPKHDLIYGATGDGIVEVEFDYKDSKVSNIKLKKSCGDKLEDAEAIRAVRQAHYESTPPAFAGHKIHFTIPINFNFGMPATQTRSSPASAHKQ